MARPSPDPDRRARQILAAARQVFAEKGFRGAQMTDIAAAMGVSPGTLYNTVASKDTLFEAVLNDAFGLADDLPALLKREPGDIIERIAKSVRENELFPVMAAALEEDLPSDPGAFTVLLRAVVEEQYDFMVRNGDGVRILEKSTFDFPELSLAYFGFWRARVLERWETFVARAQARGHMPNVADGPIAARAAIEVLAWWTIHNRLDPTVHNYDVATRRSEVTAFVIRALA